MSSRLPALAALALLIVCSSCASSGGAPRRAWSGARDPLFEGPPPAPVAVEPAARAEPSASTASEAWEAPAASVVQSSARYEQRGVKNHNANVMIGSRQLQNGDWGSAGSQFYFAMSQDSKIESWPVSVDFGFSYSASGTRNYEFEGGDYSAASDIWEWDLGALKRFGIGSGVLQPYVGLGVSLVRASGKLEIPGIARDTDWGFGLYGRLGFAVEINPGSFVGLDFRYLGLTDVTLSGVDTDVDGGSLALNFAFGF